MDLKSNVYERTVYRVGIPMTDTNTKSHTFSLSNSGPYTYSFICGLESQQRSLWLSMQQTKSRVPYSHNKELQVKTMDLICCI
jgi:hypothetical protein